MPKRDLAVARMATHITYLSKTTLHRKFNQRLQNRATLTYEFDANFQIENYLHHQNYTFVDHFDPNSYLYITHAMDYFDLTKKNNNLLSNTFTNTPIHF